MLMGAPLVRAPLRTLTLFVALIGISSNAFLARGDAGDSESLLKFKASLGAVGGLESWNESSSPCTDDGSDWDGVLCLDGHVWGLQLESMGLTGEVNVDPLVSFPYLRTLSFVDNGLNGSFPRLNRLTGLKSVFLSSNEFSGDIPDDGFAGMNYLKKVLLENNSFTGQIPSSLASLPRLLELRLDENQFLGSIPSFPQKRLKLLNVSNNNLAGPIPAELAKMDQSLFLGNQELCGAPLESCLALTPANPPADPPANPPVQPPVADALGKEDVHPPIGTSNESSGTKIAIIVSTIGVALMAMSFIFILCLRKKQTPKSDQVGSFEGHIKIVSNTMKHVRRPPQDPKNLKKAERGGKLTFVRDDRERFDFPDLLRASAEVLGSGNFGASYKAALFSGAVVVKRFKLMSNVGREEFHEHMRRLGRLQHQNLLPIVAYYYRKEEKLLVFDFVQKRSLASHLHGKHTRDQPGLDWPTRLKIIKGVVKGMAYLYSELPSLIVPHGHLKSSNVLLNESFEPLLMDYALVPLINPESAQQLMVAYKSPEYAQLGRILKKTDVWSLGILILEVLTGRFPSSYLTKGSGTSDSDLVSWVNSIAMEESSPEVFDMDMGGTKNAEGEMKKLLMVGLAACKEEVERRWELREVVKKVEEVKERGHEQ